MGKFTVSAHNDTKSTKPPDKAESEVVLHNYLYEHDKEYRLEADREAGLARFLAEDPPLQDASASMLLMAQGPKILSAYSHPVPTTVGRVVNSIKEKSSRSLLGMPKVTDMKNFFKNSESRDNVLWRGTGNAIKLDAWNKATTE